MREALYGLEEVKVAMRLMFQRGIYWLENHNPDTDDGWGSIIDKVISDCMPEPATQPPDALSECGELKEQYRLSDQFARSALLERDEARVMAKELAEVFNGMMAAMKDNDVDAMARFMERGIDAVTKAEALS